MPRSPSRVRTCRLLSLILLAVVAAAPVSAATFTVTNTNNDGANSLRQALVQAGTSAGADTIRFNIAGTAPFTIAPLTALPSLDTAGITIDGSTQPGFAGKPLIVLDGAGAGDFSSGLFIGAANCVVKSLVIAKFHANGMVISGAAAAGTQVTGCYIGLNAAGTAAAGNGNAGIYIEAGATNTVVGGSTVAARNVISGNGSGINIFGVGTDGTRVQGNYIGTNAAGTVAIGNSAPGIFLGDDSGHAGPKGTLIGGTVTSPGAPPGNVLTGNFGGEVSIGGAGTNNTKVQGNLIGTDATGTKALKALAGRSGGVSVTSSAQGTLIGGTTATVRNVISGNDIGVAIFATVGGPAPLVTDNIVVRGNYIGTNKGGTAAVANRTGIYAESANNTIGGAAGVLGQPPGNLISGNSGNGIDIQGAGATGNTVRGNLIGTDVNGAVAVPNDLGIIVRGAATGNTLGGATAAERNIIAANDSGVILTDAGTEHNTIQGNFIGTNRAGTAALANRDYGISIIEGASRNAVGGTAPGQRNVISANGVGVAMQSGATANTLVGNFIGPDAGGLKALPGAHVGVLLVNGAESNVIGGTTVAARNVISGNAFGVSIDNGGTKSNTVFGNSIGVNANGTALGNSVVGIEITSGATDNSIGGTAAGAGNTIAFNGNSGVRVSEDGTFGNPIRGNSIFSNGGLGINLEGARENPDPVTAKAPTANDSGDADSGPNRLQNFPAITSLTSAGGNTTISGKLGSLPNVTFGIDFYVSPAGDSSGFGEGKTFLASKDVKTDAAGNVTFSLQVPGTYSGPVISATATNVSTRDTSEFSPLSGAEVVTNTDDDGLGSLRSALRIASALGGTTVRFNIPAASAVGGVFTIRPLSPLPALTANGTVIDGTTQTTFGGNTNAAGPEIVLNGGLLPNDAFGGGLEINADDCAVRGLAVGGFATGISVFGTGDNVVASGTKIEGCYIGTTPAGTALAAMANEDGIRLGSDGFSPGSGTQGTTIGGNTAAMRNIISNNNRFGVNIGGASTGGNQVLGNYIGTDPTGNIAVPNFTRSVVISSGAHDNVIGAPGAVARNLIFSNGEVGVVLISDTGSDRNKVQGNYIGTNRDGTAALVTGNDVPDIFGVRISNGAKGNMVGGTAPGAGNVISGLTNGIGVGGVGTTGNLVQGNFVGLNAAGTAELPNIGNGVIVSGGAQNNVIGASATATGAVVALAGNRIFASGDGDGIRVFAAAAESTTGNTIRGNRIGNSGGLGINLFPAGEAGATVTLNDAGDADAGPNNQQNFPVITGQTTAGGSVTLTGTFSGRANRSIVIDLYRSSGETSSCGGTDIAEGELYVDSRMVQTGATGTIGFTFSAPTAGGPVFTVTATDTLTGDTSEFSPVQLGGGGTIVTNTGDGGPGSLRSALATAGSCGPTPVTFNIPTTDPGFHATTGAFTIQVASPLPAIASAGLSVDGTSQPGYAGRPIIVLNGANAGSDATGLTVTGATNIVKGLVIGGFRGRQISISGAGATGNIVQGCYIGTDATGNAGVNGGGAGIQIGAGARNSKIGGTAAGEANRIAFNGGDGVVVGTGGSDTARGNSIRGNRIYGNAGLGINLNGGTQSAAGVTDNDAGDADSGPNNLQNFPVVTGLNLSSPSSVGGTIDVSLNSTPSASFTLDFYRTSAADSSGFGEGEFYLGSRTVTTDGNGNYKGTLSFSLGGNFAEQSLVATATSATGDTSEFGPCRIVVGTVNTWGYNNLGQLGDGTTTDKSRPLTIGVDGASAVIAGGAHSLALLSNGTVLSWGNNSSGQLGDGTFADRLTPVVVPGLSGVRTVAAGWYHSLALKQDGTVWAWGANSLGQLGDGTTSDWPLPKRVAGLNGIIAIAAGVQFNVALRQDGTVWCWGSNAHGQLGDGTTTNRAVPVQAKGLTGIIAVGAGAGHTVALKSGGTVQSIGWNAAGQLGNGTTNDSLVPVTATGLTTVTSIAAGYAHTLAVINSGEGVFAWGNNNTGQLGVGSTAPVSLVPLRVTNLSGVSAVAAGTGHSLAIKGDGTVWSWGNNFYGAIGDGTTGAANNRLTPVQVPGLGNAGSISGGFSHSMALCTRTQPAVRRAVAGSFWSTVQATGAASSVQLYSGFALNSKIAGDASNYVVSINGVEAEIPQAVYGVATRTVTLSLPKGSFAAGDKVTVAWQGLLDEQGRSLADGELTVTAR